MLVCMRWLSTESPIRVYRALMARLYPPGCLFCHMPLPRPGCCPACIEAIRVWPVAACSYCGRQLHEGEVCGRCLQRRPLQFACQSLYVYQGPVRQAILDWKLGAHEAAVRWLLDAAAARLRQQIQATDLLLPVPMPIRRMRKTGRHHAAWLCRHISRITGAGWDWRLLRRIGEQPRQSSLSGRARWHNLRKAFTVDNDYISRSQVLARVSRLWLVDDILTTGATLHYAARAVKKTGLPVGLLSLARTGSDG